MVPTSDAKAPPPKRAPVRAKTADNRGSAPLAGASIVQVVREDLVPVAHQERGAARRAIRGAALGIVHVPRVHVEQARGLQEELLLGAAAEGLAELLEELE